MPARRFQRLLITGLVSVLLVTLIAGARAFLLTGGETTDPLVYSGAAGETVDARRFTMEVTDVEFARAISDDSNLSELPTDDVWLVVTATLTATTDTLNVLQPVLLENDNGYSYAASPLVTWSLGGSGMDATTLDPEIPLTAAMVFEVPPDRVTGPRVRVTVGDTTGDRLSSEAVADLGLDDEEVRAGIEDAAEDVEIPKREYGEPGADTANGDGQ